VSLQVLEIIAGGSAGAAALCAPSTTYYPGRRLLARLAPVLVGILATFSTTQAGIKGTER